MNICPVILSHDFQSNRTACSSTQLAGGCLEAKTLADVISAADEDQARVTPVLSLQVRLPCRQHSEDSNQATTHVVDARNRGRTWDQV